MELIRKISIGVNYKNDSMHYSVGQRVYDDHEIVDIVENEKGDVILFIIKDDIVKRWKKFNSNMAISVEYNLDFD